MRAQNGAGQVVEKNWRRCRDGSYGPLSMSTFVDVEVYFGGLDGSGWVWIERLGRAPLGPKTRGGDAWNTRPSKTAKAGAASVSMVSARENVAGHDITSPLLSARLLNGTALADTIGDCLLGCAFWLAAFCRN